MGVTFCAMSVLITALPDKLRYHSDIHIICILYLGHIDTLKKETLKMLQLK